VPARHCSRPCKAPSRIKRARGVQAAVELACGRLVGPRELLSPAAQERRHLCDPEASWGRRHAKKPGPKDELFFGYYFSLATMVNDEGEDAVPELVRAMVLSSCHLDPVVSFVPVLERLCASGCPSATCSRTRLRAPQSRVFALPMRALGRGW